MQILAMLTPHPHNPQKNYENENLILLVLILPHFIFKIPSSVPKYMGDLKWKYEK